MSRYSRNKKKSTASNYTHRFRALGLTNDVFKSKHKMKEFVICSPYFPNDIIYKQSNNNNNSNNRRKRKPKEKNSDELRGAIESRSKQVYREMKPNITTFDNDTVGATPQEIAIWLGEHAPPGFRPTVSTVTEFENRGFHIANIMHLITAETTSLRNNLGLNDGQWAAVLCVHDKMFRGEIKFKNQRSNSNNQNNNNQNNNNQNNNNQSNAQFNNQFNENNNNNNIQNIPNVMSGNNNNNIPIPNANNIPNPKPTANDNNDSSNGKSMTKQGYGSNNYDQYGLWEHIPRRTNEGSSNYKQRARQGRVDPYFAVAGSGQIRIFDIIKDCTFDVYKSSLGHQWAYDKTSPYFKFYHSDLLEKIMLRQHNCTRLYARFIAQRDTIQNVLTNKRLRFDWAQNVRVSAGQEFALGTTIGEKIQLLVRIPKEQDAYTYNQQWMGTDIFGGDYTLGEANPPFDGYIRVPRSATQIQQLVEQQKSVAIQTVWYVRSDPFKLHTKLAAEGKWEDRLKLFDDLGVLSWMPVYLARFFPGKEEEAKRIGLLKNDVNNDDMLMDNEEKQDVDFSFL